MEEKKRDHLEAAMAETNMAMEITDKELQQAKLVLSVLQSLNGS